FGDANRSPATPPKAVPLGTNKSVIEIPTPDYLNKGPQLNNFENLRYYFRVRTSPDGTGTPISNYNPDNYEYEGESLTLEKFKDKYGFNGAASGLVERVDNISYFNQGDLGIGRQMSCSKKLETDETACFVENYGSTDRTP